MPTKTITICTLCGRKTCDGGRWKMVSVMDLKSNQETIKDVYPGNLENCTMSFFGKNREHNYKPLGSIATKVFMNWTEPSKVTFQKVEM